jgi:hypothetical protein
MSEEPRPSRWVYFGLGVLAVAAIFILIIGYLDYSPINRRNAARIRHGMPEKTVTAILGPPANAFPLLDRKFSFWHSHHGTCSIVFDRHGDVMIVSFDEQPCVVQELLRRAKDLLH